MAIVYTKFVEKARATSKTDKKYGMMRKLYVILVSMEQRAIFYDFYGTLTNVAVTDVLRGHDPAIKLFIISSSSERSIKQFLTKAGVIEKFTAIYGYALWSNKEDQIRICLEEYSLNPKNAIFVTDTVDDIHVARKLGLTTIGVTWGLDSEAVLAAEHPDAVAHTPAELEAVQKAAFMLVYKE